MAFIPKVLGFGGGGANYEAGSVPIELGASTDQANAMYNLTRSGIDQQQAFVNALAGQGGLANQAAVYGQMQDLAGQLGAQARGEGPNVALNQLAQTTGQNVAQQAALMASQRGTAANPALLARQAAQQGAATQQQAAGQAATLRAQQQMAAQQALAQQQGMMGNMANAQIGQQQTGLNALNQFTQGGQQNVLNALAQQNQARVSQQNAMNAANAQVQSQVAKSQGTMMENMMPGIGKGIQMIPSLFGAEGGEIPNLKENYDDVDPREHFASYFAEGGKVRDMKKGGHVPGKPKVGGAKNDYANDTVPAMLSPGEIVLPRSVTKSQNPQANAAKFVNAVLAKKRMKK